jgi:hypothetical protein
MKVAENLFTSYDLEPREELEGKSLNLYQRAVLQNRIALYSQEKLAWRFDPNNVTECVAREAYLGGQIALLTELLAESDLAQAELLHYAQTNQPI